MADGSDWTRQNFKKTSAYVCKPGPQNFPSMSFHGGAVKGYADGREVEAKEVEAKDAGLKSSASDSGGWWDKLKDRVTAGNIDDPTSRAYNQYGAGRGRIDEQSNKGIDGAERVLERQQDREETEDVRKRSLKENTGTTEPAASVSNGYGTPPVRVAPNMPVSSSDFQKNEMGDARVAEETQLTPAKNAPAKKPTAKAAPKKQSVRVDKAVEPRVVEAVQSEAPFKSTVEPIDDPLPLGDNKIGGYKRPLIIPKVDPSKLISSSYRDSKGNKKMFGS